MSAWPYRVTTKYSYYVCVYICIPQIIPIIYLYTYVYIRVYQKWTYGFVITRWNYHYVINPYDHIGILEEHTVYPNKYAHGFVVFCFVVVMQSFIMNSHEVFILIHQGCFAGTGAIVRLPQCQRSKPGGYRKISQCITTTKHSKAKTVCTFLGIYCICKLRLSVK